MRCDEFEVRLNQVLDRRRSPSGDPQLRDHAQVCPDCREQLATMRRLFDGLDLWEVPTLADDFALRVVSQVVPAPIHPQRSSWMPWAIASAAVLLLSLLPGYWFLRPPTSPVATTWSQRGVDSPAPAYTGTPASENGDRIIADRSLWTLYGNSLLELYPEATRERHRQQVSEIAADLRPIATPFNAAVTAIRRTIPVGRAPEKGRPRASLVPHSTSRTIS
jgi:hypothetical protein